MRKKILLLIFVVLTVITDSIYSDSCRSLTSKSNLDNFIVKKVSNSRYRNLHDELEIAPVRRLVCFAWLAHPFWIQLVAALKIAKSSESIRDKAHCYELAGDGARLAEICRVPSIISTSLAECSCDDVF
ncbi:hypothetical protein V6Z05_15030 [Leptospira venezuelensis]|uniref:hypothetical protein n=1 Tax=Leptospira venezuelensis TaxID=1958811 RepID=UPI0012FF8A50|nr:hypothetical protein [Leptospira venezuelensis]